MSIPFPTDSPYLCIFKDTQRYTREDTRRYCAFLSSAVPDLTATPRRCYTCLDASPIPAFRFPFLSTFGFRNFRVAYLRSIMELGGDLGRSELCQSNVMARSILPFERG